ncbi:hypothetical protein N7462_008948 [Penicillium macrosclerotiorum]|uniref:uncharacterized protein n=1 Tax=Penicillium macrosclerotiorum TaxID=303699 RepID=UPI00254955BE|nr:uncharacterized protein N7462_008948 [Penicillium macrosclerotiorum]KAJ5676051.1 hypothetical protein N7462_008948 [Penicillium macrosclerotiorum]
MATISRCNDSMSIFFILVLAVLILATATDVQEVKVVTVERTVEAATVTIQATPTAPSPASYTSLKDFKNTILSVSNEYRSTHDAEPLLWNETLVKYAKNWAETCIWKHSGGPYGENLAFGYANASAAVAAWGDEGELYNFHKPTGFTEKTGHFTQLVWKSTTEVGCATINCGYTQDNKSRREVDNGSASPLVAREPDGSTRAQGWYVVCEYTPAGNVVGDRDKYFKLNVKPTSSSQTTSSASTGQSTGGGTVKNGVGSTIRTMLLALATVAIGMSLYT